MAFVRQPRPHDTRWKDFRHFLFDVWHYLHLPDPSWLQLDIAHFLARGDCPKRFILEAFRGVGKSWMTVAFVVWLLYWHPEWNILVVSASKPAADNFSTFCLRLIREMPGLGHMAPSDSQRDSKIAFDIREAPASKDPSVRSLGITSQLTGSRADVIVADDVEIPSNSLTPGMRAKLSEQVKEFDAILKPEAHCRVVFLGTPQTEDSLYNKLMERGYKVCIWPSRYPNEEERKEYGYRLAPAIARRLDDPHGPHAGDPTDPGRFTDLDLRERELSYGRAGYALQFQLRTRLSDLERYPLKVHDLMVYDCDPVKAPEHPIWCNDPEKKLLTDANLAMTGDLFYRPMELLGSWLKYTGIVMAIDPAGRGKDETGYAIVGMLNGYLYVLACGGLQGGYGDETLQRLSVLAKQFEVTRVIIEANFGDGMYTKLLQPVLAKVHPVTCEEVRHSMQKEKRLCDTLEPVFQGHKIILNAAVIQQDFDSIQGYPVETGFRYSLVYQLSRLTKEKGSLVQDDRLDALAIAVAYWIEQMGLDVADEMEAHKAELLDRELERFVANCLGADEELYAPVWTETMR